MKLFLSPSPFLCASSRVFARICRGKTQKKPKTGVEKGISSIGPAKLVVLCLIPIASAGCATRTGGSFCDVYEPVYPDYQKDTPETLRQIDRNNVVYDLC